MGLLNIPNMTALVTTGLGGVIISNGYEDYKKNKTAGLAKMIFGASVIGAGLYYSFYHMDLSSPRSFRHDNSNVKTNLNITCEHPYSSRDCLDLRTFIDNLLKNGNFTKNHDGSLKKTEPIVLSEKNYYSGLTFCQGVGPDLHCLIKMINITLHQNMEFAETFVSDNKDLPWISNRNIRLTFVQGEFDILEIFKLHLNYLKNLVKF